MQIEAKDGYALLELNRPPVNALDHSAVETLRRLFVGYKETTPLVIAGAGKAFSAGVDTAAFSSYSTGERQKFFRAITEMTTALCAIDAPVVAAVNGHALGGGLVITLCADYRLAVDGEHKFGLTEAQAGVPFPKGPTEIVKHEIAAPLLRQLTLSSRVVSAQTLYAHTVFDELVSADELMSSAIERARQIAQQPAFSAVKTQMRGPLREALAGVTAE